jgi:RNA polymerase sigma factor (sigma-70 family)
MAEKSFEGIVKVYKEEFYVNTETGVGLDSVLKKIDPLLCMMASKTYIPGYSFEDIKHELVLMAIDGIRSYNPDKQAMLSTFLHIHLNNKLISRIRSENKMSNDAFGLFEKNSEGDSKIRRAREELSFTQCTPLNEEGLMFEHTVSDEDGLYESGKAKSVSQIHFEVSLNKLCDKLDEKTAKIIKLIYFEDYSIKDAAKEVGLSGWAASMRLKNLSKKKYFRDIFDGYIEREEDGE